MSSFPSSLKIRTALRIGTLLLSLLLYPQLLLADELDCTDLPLSPEDQLLCLFPSEEVLIEGSPQGESGTTSLPHGDIVEDFFPFFINTALSITGTLMFIAILYSGYILVFTNDNEENINKGKKTLIYAVIGAFVVAISYAVIYGVANLDLD